MQKYAFAVLRRTCFPFILAVLFSAPNALADVVRMKNGDVYRGQIIKEEYGTSLQLLLKDGSEKRLSASEVQSVEREAVQNEGLADGAVATTRDSDSHPLISSQMQNTWDQNRFELDLATLTFDSAWNQTTLHTQGASTTSSYNVTEHYLHTLPQEATLRLYLSRWHAYFDYLNNSADDETYATIAFAYGFDKHFDAGLATDLAFASAALSGSSASAISANGSEYAFGGFFRAVATPSDSIGIELSGIIGIGFRNLTVNTGTYSLSGNGTTLLSTARIMASFAIVKQVSLLCGIDGWLNVGSLSGNILTSSAGATGSLDDNI